MKILKSWISDYFSGELSTERFLKILELSGLDVKEVLSKLDEKVIVVKILEIKGHPNADKLKIAKVSDGNNSYQIICGASNIAVGQIVPLALPGARIKGTEIKKAVICGIESLGMLCSEKELGLGENQAGIMILADDYQLGNTLRDCLGDDLSVEVDITANRGDCLSHIGIAREIAVFQNSDIKKEPIKLTKISSAKIDEIISLEVKNSELCFQYFCRVISGVKIAPSPKWLQRRLIACGAKPINNVVDVTNYILLDLGHPLHAFDLKKIKGQKIIIRKAKSREKIKTLDEEVRDLDKEMLVIADSEKAIAIAGIMGGLNSEVDAGTETVVIEAAEFEPRSIRKTSKRLGLTTEASYRFERGVDSGGIEYAINKAVELITQVAGGKVLQGVTSCGQKPDKVRLKIKSCKINQLLGLNLSAEEINHTLRHLGFMIDGETAIAPFWRHDISIWQDLAEEIGRVYGYDKIKPLQLPTARRAKKTEYYFLESIKDFLVSAGFTEMMNYPFLSEVDISATTFNTKNLLEIANPLQSANRYLRNSLIPGVLKNIGKNSSIDPILIFEIAHVFSKSTETTNLAIAVSGRVKINLQDVVDNLSVKFNLDHKLFKFRDFSCQELKNYKIKKSTVSVAEIDLSGVDLTAKIDQTIKLVKTASGKYRGISKFPAVIRDLAFIVDAKVKAIEIEESIYLVSKLINCVELFDEFTSPKLGQDKKNLAFHLSLQSKEKTLIDSEANEVISDIIAAIEKKFKAKLRK